MSLLTVSHLSRSFGGVKAVQDVSMSIPLGSLTALIGPNGAGKTTLFSLISGFTTPDTGTVIFDGKDITQLRMHERARTGIGYLPQEPSVFRKLTVAENILAITEAVGMAKSLRGPEVELRLKELNLTSVADQKAYTLSGGERRRLEIARTLVMRPKFLLMDEPFAAIDPISVSEVQKIILQLKSQGIGIIVTDHNVRETLRIVDRAYLIHKGKVLTEGSGDFLIQDAQAKKFYLGENFDL